MIRPFLASVTRISDLSPGQFGFSVLPQNQWQTGDYVVGKVLNTRGHLKNIELTSGRMVEVMEGDLVVGAWGGQGGDPGSGWRLASDRCIGGVSRPHFRRAVWPYDFAFPFPDTTHAVEVPGTCRA